MTETFEIFRSDGRPVRVTVPDDERFYATLAEAIANANLWQGRCCVVPAAGGFLVSSHWDAMRHRAVYVTVGMRYRDWERGWGLTSPTPSPNVGGRR